MIILGTCCLKIKTAHTLKNLTTRDQAMCRFKWRPKNGKQIHVSLLTSTSQGKNEYPLGEFTASDHISSNYRTQVQPSCINISPFLLSTGKLRNHASCTAEMETQRAAISVPETPQNELSISLTVTHMSSIMKKCVLIVLWDKWTITTYGVAG